MSAAAVDYINENWRRFRSPRALYRALRKEGDKQGWTLPSESWLYRRWQEMPEVVRVSVIEGKAAYESRYAPYVPRNYEDLEALQVVCGDHSERDITVLVDGKDLARPWLTAWVTGPTTWSTTGCRPFSGASDEAGSATTAPVRSRLATERPTGRPGVYHADVVFPSEGTWSYEVWDDFSQTHTFRPVEIAAPADGSSPLLALLGVLGLAAGLAALTVLSLRHRRPEPEPIRLKEAA